LGCNGWAARLLKGMGRSRQHIPHTFEFVALEFSAARRCPRQPPVHQCHQVAPNVAVIAVAAKHFLRITRVHGNLSLPGVIAAAPEWAIDPHLLAGAGDIKRHTALGRRFLQRGLRLDVVDAGVSRLIHQIRGEFMQMLR